VPLERHALDALTTLEGVGADLVKVAGLGRGGLLSAEELESLRTDAAEFYAQDVIDAEIVPDPVETFTRLVWVRSRPEWGVGIAVVVDEVYFHAGNLYKAIQAHTTQSDWLPDVTPALWRRFYEPEAGPQPWVQPQGAHDAYNIGDRVTYQGNTWESTVNANVWAPGVFGWVEV
jgi:hypothetical protein